MVFKIYFCGIRAAGLNACFKLMFNTFIKVLNADGFREVFVLCTALGDHNKDPATVLRLCVHGVVIFPPRQSRTEFAHLYDLQFLYSWIPCKRAD